MKVCTFSEAASILNVSESYVVDLVESDQIEVASETYDNWLNHHLSLDSVMAYKNKMIAESNQAINELATLSEEMGLYE